MVGEKEAAVGRDEVGARLEGKFGDKDIISWLAGGFVDLPYLLNDTRDRWLLVAEYSSSKQQQHASYYNYNCTHRIIIITNKSSQY